MATSNSRTNQLHGGTGMLQSQSSTALQSSGSKRSSVKSGSRHRGDSPPSPRQSQNEVPQTPVRMHDPTVPQTVHAASHQAAKNLNYAGVSTPKDPPKPMRTQRPATADRPRAAPSSRHDSPGKEARSRAAGGKGEDKKDKTGDKNKKEDTGIHSLSDTQLAERYSFDKEIGFGNWGSCWLASAKKTLPNVPGQIPIAIKLVHRQKTAPSNARVRALWNEFKVLRSCGKDMHPNIVRFREFVITPSYALVVMDYYRQPMNVALPVSTYSGPNGYFRQLLSGLHWLHSHNVTHNDIKVANILVNTEPSKGASEDGRGQPILVDFGFSTIHTPPNFSTRQCVGTPEYLDPARCRGELHDERLSDVWALGVTFFEIATGRTPFEHEDEQFLSKEQLEKYYQRTIAADWVGTWNIPSKLEDLCRKMLKVSAAERITAEDALQHPFFDPLPDVHGDDLNESLMELLESGGRGSQAASQISALSQRPPSASSSIYCPDGAARGNTTGNMSQLSLESVGSRSSPGLSALGNDSNVSELMKGSAPWEKPGASHVGVISTPVRPPRRVEGSAAPDTVRAAKAQHQTPQSQQPTPQQRPVSAQPGLLGPSAFEDEGSQPSTSSLHEGDVDVEEPAKAPDVHRKRSLHTPIKNALRNAASRIKTPTFTPQSSLKIKGGLTGGRHTPPVPSTTVTPATSPYNGPSHASTAIQTGDDLFHKPTTVAAAAQTVASEHHTVGVQYEFLRTYSKPYRSSSFSGKHSPGDWANRQQQQPSVNLSAVREKSDVAAVTVRSPTSESEATERDDRAMALPTSASMRHSSSCEQMRRQHFPQTQVPHSSSPVAEVISQQLTSIVSMTSSLFHAVEQTRSMLTDLHLAPPSSVSVLDDAVAALTSTANHAQRAQLQGAPAKDGLQPTLVIPNARPGARGPVAKDFESRRRSLIPIRLGPSGEATSDSDNASSPLHNRSVRRASQLEKGPYTGAAGLRAHNSESSIGGDDSMAHAAGRYLHHHQQAQELSIYPSAPTQAQPQLSAGPSPTLSYHTASLTTPHSGQQHLLRPAKSGQFESGNEADGSNFSETENGSNAPAPQLAGDVVVSPPPVPRKAVVLEQDQPNMWRSSIVSAEHLNATAVAAAHPPSTTSKKLAGVRSSLRKKLSSQRIQIQVNNVHSTLDHSQQQQQRPISMALHDSRAHSMDNLGRFAAQPNQQQQQQGYSNVAPSAGKKVHLAAPPNERESLGGFSRRGSTDDGKRRSTLLTPAALIRTKSLQVRETGTADEDGTPSPFGTGSSKNNRSRPASIVVASEHAASFLGASPIRHSHQGQGTQHLQQTLQQHHQYAQHPSQQQQYQRRSPEDSIDYQQASRASSVSASAAQQHQQSVSKAQQASTAAQGPPITPVSRGALWRLLRGVGSRSTAVQRTV